MRALWLALWTGNVLKQTDGMVGSVVVGCAGAPSIEATVLTAVGPGSNPASDGLLLLVIPPLSAFCLFLSVLSIRRHKKINKINKTDRWMEASIRAQLVKYHLEKK